MRPRLQRLALILFITLTARCVFAQSSPSIAALTPTSGPVGASVTITGTNFGSTQGSSTVTFNGVSATALGNWSNTAVTVTVPSGATTGNVVVTVNGVASNGVSFTIASLGFTTTGALNVPRSFPNATLLDNGKVLIVGGVDANWNPLPGAEVYDPATSSFATVSSTIPGGWGTATLLANGQVLMVGGMDSSFNVLAGAELYDPATGTFAPTGSLNTAREAHSATLLPNGEVLIAGGWGTNGVLASAELYNPATGTFTAAGNMNAARLGHTATRLTNGQVLLASGWGGNNELPSAELYDPVAGTFTLTGSLNMARDTFTSTLLNNGKVLIVGSDGDPTVSTELYDPGSGTFTVVGSAGDPRPFSGVTLLNSGQVLIAGGIDSNWNALASAELYDPVAGTFTATSSLNTAREGPATELLVNGEVLIAGGVDINSNLLASAELYQPGALTPSGLVSITLSPQNVTITAGTGQQFTATGTFIDNSTQTLASVTWSSSNSAVVQLSNDAGNRGEAWGIAQGSATVSACTGSVCGSTTLTAGAAVPVIASLTPAIGAAGTSVLITGANFGSSQGSSTVSFNGTSATPTSWSATAITAPVPTGAATGNVVVTVNSVASNGLLFTVPPPPYISGLSPNSGPVGTSVIIAGTNFGMTQGSSTVTLNGASLSPTNWTDTSIAIVVPLDATTGNIIIVTAYGGASNAAEFMVVASTGTATPGNLNAASYGPTGNLLDNGTVLITGGMDSNYNPLPNAEIYDPTAGTFTLVGNLNTARDSQTTTLLNSGWVLVAGGASITGVVDPPLATAELYNPATESFLTTGSMSTARLAHTATLLNNGLVLVVGGLDANNNLLSSAEIYNPATPNFTLTGSLNAARQDHTATLLNNGMVLIVGGWDANYNPLGSAEIYNPVTGIFSTTGSLNTARSNHTATLLNNGKVLIAGGEDSNWNALASAEIYDPVSGTFTLTASLNTGRESQTATLLNNGQVLLAGGWDINFNVLASLELYDPAAGTFTSAGSLSTARGEPAVTLLDGGAVLFAGGKDNNGNVLASAELYQPPTLTPPGLVSIAVSPTNSSTPLGSGQQLTATGTFSDNSTQVLTSATWSSSDTSIAVLSNDATNHGNAYGVAQGTATVIACTGSICGSTTLTVGPTTVLAPGITGLSPSSGAAGTVVTITGANFGAPGSDTVTFNGIPASVVSGGTASITVQVPGGAATGNVVVTVNGVASNGVPFTIVPIPNINGISPNSGLVGTAVTITGTNFGAAQGISTVTFNGAAATPTSWSDTSITVPVPTGATTGNVVVTVSNAASNGVNFIMVPSITSITPATGSGGTPVTITGADFGATQGTSSITFNGTAAAPTSWSDTSIAVPVPAGATTGNVVVAVAGVASNGVAFTVALVTGQTVLSDSMGRTTTYGYQNVDGRNFVTLIIGSGCASCGGRGNTGLAYDPLGNLLSSSDALGNTTSYTYDSMGNVLTKSQQLNASTTLTWTYTYNSLQEVLTATDPLGNVTTNVYDANGNLLSTTTPPPSGTGSGLTTNFQYNTLGELTQVTDPQGNSTTLTYTSAGLVASITDAQSNTTSFTYDARGNRLTSVDALNHTTTYTYDAMNRLTRITAPDTTYTQFGYDYRGRRTSVTDANGKTTSYQYDDADRLVSVTNAASNLTVYGYDTENNMVAITDAANHETQFSYDALGRVTQVTFPSTLSEGYTYDAMNNLLTKTDRKGQTINYGYDALYRLTSKTYPDQTAVNYTYDPVNRLTQVTDPTGTYSFTYDNLGRLVGTGTQYSFLSTLLTNSYAYDAASNRVSLATSESGITNYAYDSLNRLTSLTDSTTGQFGFGYDALGRRTSLTRPNGVNTSYTYDNLSHLLSVLHNGGNLPGSTGYTYDAAGNRLTKTALQQADPNPVSVLSQYSYDPIYELTQAVVNGSVIEGYSYDPVGNRLTSAGPTSYSYNSSNELSSTSAAGYTYDNNGNTISKTSTAGTTSYTWDFENRLSSVTLPGTGGTVNFKYDPFGRRIYKSSSASTNIYVYDRENVIQQLNGAGSLIAQYTQGTGIDEPLAVYSGASTAYFHADGLGSTVSLTDSAGNLAASYSYDSFGNLTASTGSVTNPFQYTGRELDSETSLYYYRARYYDPVSSRLLSEDPVGFLGGSVNFYGYVFNNPVLFNDPIGLWANTSGKRPPPTTNTIVCDGRGGIRPQLGNTGSTPGQRECLGGCVKVHEESHIADALASRPKVCKGKPDGIEVTWTSTKEVNASEVRAYNAEIDCLKKKEQAACHCKQIIDDRINQLEVGINAYRTE